MLGQKPPSRPIREVPAFKLDLWSASAHDTCVVIPVINEGVRIRSLVERMFRLGIHRIADIILVDGGSCDGSLDPAYLEPRGIRGVVTKLGPGRLSSQLRCGYAVALDDGYEHIVTIDGNDKDDPAAIPQMIDSLRAGADFVQASRFDRGGVAENTPLIRWLAIRLIHAPLLALASGFAWTDTTQGFRGYSRRLLQDHRIGVFRNCFQNYELLAYLSYRAPRLGFRCAEVPSARRYPIGVRTPTKISSVRGNLDLFTTLVRVCVGGFDPPIKL
jgi:glycosyltransferase involved in cell wall biosynthesis